MPFGLQIVTPPDTAREPVSYLRALDHLRLDEDDADISLIGDLITSARELCERLTRRQFHTATFRLSLDAFPGCGIYAGTGRAPGGYAEPLLFGTDTALDPAQFLRGRSVLLPRPPLQSVTSVAYVDTAGVTQTLDPSAYQVDADNEPGRVLPAWGKDWPATREQANAVQITYVAGYAYGSTPATIRRAILLLLGHWYDAPNAADAASLKEIPHGLSALLSANIVPTVY